MHELLINQANKKPQGFVSFILLQIRMSSSNWSLLWKEICNKKDRCREKVISEEFEDMLMNIK